MMHVARLLDRVAAAGVTLTSLCGAGGGALMRRLALIAVAQLFSNRNNVGPDDVVVYLERLAKLSS